MEALLAVFAQIINENAHFFSLGIALKAQQIHLDAKSKV